MKPAIDVQNLSKTFRAKVSQKGFLNIAKNMLFPKYKSVKAVDCISFKIEPGERVAFVGPNGAGKSTTIKMLSGILYPTSGQILVDGHIPWKDRKQLPFKIGAVFGQRSQLWQHLPAVNSFELLARIYNLSPSTYKKQLNHLAKTFKIESFMNNVVRGLSLGQRMRCEIVASLLHKPKILFLDEPTIGLDVTAKAIIQNLIRKQSYEENTTILLTSHDTLDMERVCKRIIVINKGKVLLDQPIKELRRNYIKQKMVTVLTEEISISIDLAGIKIVKKKPNLTKLEIDTEKISIQKAISDILKQYKVEDITIEDPPMEEIIKNIYQMS